MGWAEQMTERANGWLKFALAMLPFAIAFLVGWGALNTRVNNVREVQLQVLANKADRQTVDVQYAAILRELQAMNQRFDRLERR